MWSLVTVPRRPKDTLPPSLPGPIPLGWLRMLAILPTPRESVPREMCPPCLALTLGARQTVRAFGSALDAFMVRVKELDGVLLQLIKVIGDGMAPPEQLSRFQRLIVDAGALAKVCRRALSAAASGTCASCPPETYATLPPTDNRIRSPMHVCIGARCSCTPQPHFWFSPAAATGSSLDGDQDPDGISRHSHTGGPGCGAVCLPPRYAGIPRGRLCSTCQYASA